MITEFLAPKTGLTAETIAIGEWYKKEGDKIEKDELLVTIESEKASLEINAPRPGFLLKILAKKGQEDIPVSQAIALISDSPDESID